MTANEDEASLGGDKNVLKLSGGSGCIGVLIHRKSLTRMPKTGNPTKCGFYDL